MTNDENKSMRSAAQKIARKLIEKGYESFFVGGGVRDQLLGLPIKDIDIATNAHPNEVIKIFPGSNLVGASFGVVIVKQDKYRFEIATFRKDSTTSDGRRPDFVTFGIMEEDVRRRDFTINALYQHPITNEITDLINGLDDLRQKQLRCVGNPNLRFKEDYLRLLRAIRFAARFNFKIEKHTFKAIVKHAHHIRFVAHERVREELDRMITGPHPALALDLLHNTGLLKHILPEVEQLIRVEQDPIWHHKEFEFSDNNDVFEHTKLTLESLEPRISTHAWACLLHDVAKYDCSCVDEKDGRIHAYQHHKIGADSAKNILYRLRFSSDQITLISKIVYDHMKPMVIKDMKRSKLRRFLGSGYADAVLAVHRADCLASNGDLSCFEFAMKALDSFEEEPVLPEPLINGQHLIDLGLTPSPMFSELLHEVQTRQLNEEITTKQQAIEVVKVLLSHSE